MQRISSLPTPMKWLLGIGGATAFGVTAGSVLRSAIWIFLICLAVLLVLLVAGYFLWSRWKRSRRNAQLRGELKQHATVSPRSVSDPGHRARLDDLRRKFEEGIAEFRSRGKDIYKLPWLVLVGPPGSGKTEAVRHCNVGFPPGMHDPFQGVGGTINMNWWFTNRAVVLDTAGRLMFEEVKTGETSEWREFLNLLKKNRYHCPINGLLLTIPVDSLVKDTADEIAAKAGRIALQLDVIQRVLDVRFPVFVIVTKCDLLTGFREFFEEMNDPHLQHQIMGWSNPAPLDTPFDPKEVDRHLETVSARLRRRRFGMLRDPIADPSSAGGRRTDEVDSLFSLPQSLERIGPRLRLYLETIFTAGEWSSKPLFLRGIYFTSSLREGVALDQELAQAIGVPVEHLPAGRSWERERAYFLRDLFLEKVFPEKGLVTRASNTNQLVRRRRTALFSAGFAALAVFLLLSWFGMKNFQTRIGRQSEYWSLASEDWDRRVWRPIVAPVGDGYTYLGDKPVAESLPADVDRARFHAELREFVRQPLELGIFSVLAPLGHLATDRREAQKAVFDGGVLRPLVESARQKLSRTPAQGRPEVLQRQAEAMATLIELEKRLYGAPKREVDEREAAGFLAPLLSFTLEQSVSPDAVDTNLTETLAWTYSEGAGEAWPPDWLSAGDSLSSNQPLAIGLRNFIAQVNEQSQAAETGIRQIQDMRTRLRSLQSLEMRLLTNANPPAELLGTVVTNGAALIRHLDQLGETNGPPAIGASLTSTYHELIASNLAGFTNAFRPVLQAVDFEDEAFRRGFPDPSLLGATNQPPLVAEVRNLLTRVREGLTNRLEALTAEELAEIETLDQRYLVDYEGKRMFAARLDLYRQTHEMLMRAQTPLFDGSNWVGQAWAPFRQWHTHLDELSGELDAYQGALDEEMSSTCQAFLDHANRAASLEAAQQFARQGKELLTPWARFPLVRDSKEQGGLPVDQLEGALTAIEQVRSDLTSTNLNLLHDGARQEVLFGFSRTLKALNDVGQALLGTNDSVATVTVSLSEVESSQRRWTRGYRVMSLNRDNPEQGVRTDAQGNPELGVVPLNAPMQFHLFRTYTSETPDRSFAPGDWAAVRLVLSSAVNPPAGGTNFLVRLPPISEWEGEGTPAAEGEVEVRLTFEEPLPPRDVWPTFQEIEQLSSR